MLATKVNVKVYFDSREDARRGDVEVDVGYHLGGRDSVETLQFLLGDVVQFNEWWDGLWVQQGCCLLPTRGTIKMTEV